MKIQKDLISKIPKEVSYVTDKLEEAGFEAYLVGGSVRDLLMNNSSNGVPKDWDITTNAKPNQIRKLFKKTVYKNTFGTVGVCIPLFNHISPSTNESLVSDDVSQKESVSCENINNVKHETLKSGIYDLESEYMIIEVTPYRTEANYSDFRHPDEIVFSDKLEDDLKRRDFTVNALALRISKGHQNLTDIFDGIKDIENKVLRTVGNADDRFKEDALRMLRAIRFSLQLDFSVSFEINESILKNADLVKKISFERIRDELVKMIMSIKPSSGIVMLEKYGLLKNIIPELLEGIGCEQSGAHIYDVWNHSLHALAHAGDKNWPLEIRLAALFHDIGKPRTRRTIFQNKVITSSSLKSKFDKKKYTFYGHEVIGAKMAKKIMERLKFSKKEIQLVVSLVRNHMFFSDTEKITLSAVRRIIMKMALVYANDSDVKKEDHPVWDLMKIRECDRAGMKKKESPYRLRKYFAMIEEALHDPLSVRALKIDGNFLIKELGFKAGPRIGWVLHALLEEILDDPNKNSKGHLAELARSLNLLPDGALRTLGERGKEKKEERESQELKKLHKKHGIVNRE
jgi:tRNA nucleotidyltransferase (CCA-adding enzyme)